MIIIDDARILVDNREWSFEDYVYETVDSYIEAQETCQELLRYYYTIGEAVQAFKNTLTEWEQECHLEISFDLVTLYYREVSEHRIFNINK